MSIEKNPSRLYKSLDREGELNKVLSKEMPFRGKDSFIEKIYSGEITDPSLSASEYAYQALTHKPNVFERDDRYAVYGQADAIKSIIALYESGSKEALLLIGPTGSGKSGLDSTIEKILAEFSLTKPLYAISGCPINEDALRLLSVIPDPENDNQSPRGIFEKDTKLHIEGELCPSCTLRLRKEPDLNIWRVKRFILCATLGEGLGKIDPVSVLDNKHIHEINEEILRSNRCKLEIAELSKHNSQFLNGKLDFIREGELQIGKQRWQVDNIVVSHVQFRDWVKFKQDPNNSGLVARFKEVYIPYNLSTEDEVKIYKKEIKKKGDKFFERVDSETERNKIHLPLATLQAIAEFACSTRYTPTGNASLGSTLTDAFKLDYYNGETKPTEHTNALKKENETRFQLALKADSNNMVKVDNKEVIVIYPDGYTGISVELIKNELLKIISATKYCADPLWALAELERSLTNSTTDTSIFNNYKDKFETVSKKIKERVKEMIVEAFENDFEDRCKIMLNVYLDNIDAFCNKQKLKDPITEEEVEPDEKLMRSIEEKIGESENTKKTFREEVFKKYGSYARKGISFNLDSHERLKEAIKQKVREDTKPEKILRQTFWDSGQQKIISKEPTQQKIIEEAQKRLIEKGFCCHICAESLMENIANPLRNESAEAKKT